MDEVKVELAEVVERLSAAAMALEQAAARMEEQREADSQQMTTAKITATVASEREEELERKLAEAEAKIAELTVEVQANAGGRKTVGVGRMFGKANGMSEGVNAEALDGALQSLTVEQRIAVKAELMRAGLAG